MSTTTLSRDDRDTVVDMIIDDLGAKEAVKFFEASHDRRRLADYALIVDALDFDGEPRESYPIDRPTLDALRRVLAGWCDVADGWLEGRVVAADRGRETGLDRTANRDEHRLEQYSTCRNILDRLLE
jgi:hypothetical protein